MKKTQKRSIGSAAPRLAGYLRTQLGIILVALILAAASAVLTIIGPDKIGRIATIMSDGLLPVSTCPPLQSSASSSP